MFMVGGGWGTGIVSGHCGWVGQVGGVQERECGWGRREDQLCSLYSFPGRGKLDEDPLLGDASILVELDEAFCLSNGGLLVE